LRVVVLAGGTGSAKLLAGLSQIVNKLSVISNIGDNIWLYGLYICPDIDITTYCLAGILDDKGWGIKNDTFNFLSQLSRLGFQTWFKVGDKDLATHLVRTQMIKKGIRLTDITKFITNSLNVKHEIIPCSDFDVQTYVKTDKGELHLQEFWVKEQAKPQIFGIEYKGSEVARASPEALEFILNAERIVICPANPISSIGPIITVKGIREAISKSKAKKVAISPMIGSKPVSGPAGKFMQALDLRVDSVGVAQLYKGLVDALLIDKADANLSPDIESMGIECIQDEIIMKNDIDKIRLASRVLEV